MDLFVCTLTGRIPPRGVMSYAYDTSGIVHIAVMVDSTERADTDPVPVRVTLRDKEATRFLEIWKEKTRMDDGASHCVSVTGRLRPYEKEPRLYQIDIDAWEIRITGKHGVHAGEKRRMEK